MQTIIYCTFLIIRTTLKVPALNFAWYLKSTTVKIRGYSIYTGHKSVEMILSDEKAAQLKIWVVKKLEDMYVRPQLTTA
jgi:hypothetical protein